MLINTALDVESVASCGCKDGGSEATTKLRFLEAVPVEPESLPSSFDFSDESPPKPHAASTKENTARTVSNKNFLFLFM
ncbi:hypothetical protein D3C77_755800 [compost metagenome]